MLRRNLATLLIASMFFGTASWATTPLDRVLAMLAAQGFEITQTERTWLGRIKIEAVNSEFHREMVINRTTGEVLRDIWTRQNLSGNNDGPASRQRKSQGGNSGKGSDNSGSESNGKND